MGQCCCGFARNSRNRPRKIGVGQILPPALRDGPKPDIHLVQSVIRCRSCAPIFVAVAL
jgi:hypothetical protein